MSLYSAMFSGVTGLSAHAKSMSTISENIANVNTVGYKASRTSFSTLVTGFADATGDATNGVRGIGQTLIDQQGLLQSTQSSTDIAITGHGFLAVNSDVTGGVATGETLFTRAGSFTTDTDKNLVNTGGFYLMGWALNSNGDYIDAGSNVITPDPTSTADLQAVNLNGVSSTADGTDTISLRANLPASAKVSDTYQTSVHIYDALGSSHQAVMDWQKIDNVEFAGVLSTVNSPHAQTVTVPDSTGTNQTLNLNYTVVAPGSWTLTVTDAGGGAVTGGTINLTFDGAGNLTSTPVSEISANWSGTAAADSTITLDHTGLTQALAGVSAVTPTFDPDVDGGHWKLSVTTDDPTGDSITAGSTAYVEFNPDGTLKSPATHAFTVDWDDADTFSADSAITLNLGTAGTATGMSSFGDEYTVTSIDQDGLAFGQFSHVSVNDGGIVTAHFDNGDTLNVFQIPLAKFNNPNGLNPRTGNVYEVSLKSGSFLLNEAGSGGVGDITSQTLESSTVDIANEFTNMIIIQRAYSANATIITTADEMLEELSRIKR